jgi:hypothetical protein
MPSLAAIRVTQILAESGYDPKQPLHGNNAWKSIVQLQLQVACIVLVQTGAIPVIFHHFNVQTMISLRITHYFSSPLSHHPPALGVYRSKNVTKDPSAFQTAPDPAGS